MKKLQLIIASLALLSAATANAQKNTWMVDAGAGFNHADVPSYSFNSPNLSLNSASVNLAIGRQLSNHWSVGLLGGYGTQQQLAQYSFANGQPETIKLTLNTWNVGVYGRYTYWLNKNFYLYSQLSANRHGYNHNESTVASNYPYIYQPVTSNTLPEGLEVKLFPALGVNIIKGFGIHMDVGGINYTRATFSSTPTNNFNVNFGQSFHFGLHKIIGWKKMTTKVDDPNAMLR